MQNMNAVLKLVQLRWTDHVIRKSSMTMRTTRRKALSRWPEKRYKDTLKASLKDFDIPIGSWEQTAQERSKWRGLINIGAALYEKKNLRS